MITLAPQPRKPVVPDPTAHLTSVVSASRLNCFHNCRLKFYFRYVLELVKPGSAALFVGKAVHAALQAWSTARWRGQEHDASALREGFLMNWITGQEDAPVAWEAGEEDEQQEKAWGLVDMYLRDTPIPAEEKPEAVEVRVEADRGHPARPAGGRNAARFARACARAHRHPCRSRPRGLALAGTQITINQKAGGTNALGLFHFQAHGIPPGANPPPYSGHQ